MSEADVVKLCQAIYGLPGSFDWDQYWPSDDPEGICAGIKNNILIFRGSVTAQDWFRDLEAYPEQPKDHPQLGLVHAGFDEDMDEFFQQTSHFCNPDTIVGGHSLGAARAWLYAGRLVAQGSPPAGVTVFGSPRPGCLPLGQILAGVPKKSYRNGLDPVCEVPLPFATFPVIQMTDFTDIHIEPTDWSEGPMAWHNINLYAEGVT